MSDPDYRKIIQSLNYLAEKDGGEINYMKALKLLYLADRLHLRKYGRLITDDKLVAMENGTLGSQAKDIAILQSSHLPHVVYQYVEDKLKRDIPHYSIEMNNADREHLSKTDKKCIDKVFDVFGKEKEFELAKLTHELPEWKRHQYEIESGETRVVDLEIEDLFKPSNNESLNQIYSQSLDELDLSQELFSESLEHRACIEK